MLDIGAKGKQEFLRVKEELGLRTDGAVIEFLTACYEGSLQMPMVAFEKYTKLKREGK
ncbi:hypothetical protein D3C80_2064650 [compost metagenome]